MRPDPSTIPQPVRPVLVPRPWGATRLGRLLGGADARGDDAGGGDERIGEAWLAGPDAVVASGPDAGATLDELAARHGAPFVGSRPFARYGGRMPLLVKLLDASTDLSVQVHPGDEDARRLAPDRRDLGKAEAWLVLEAAPGSLVWWGFARPVSRDEVRAAAARGGLVDLMRRVEVRGGDVVVNEAGTVHSLGGGLLVYELQQASDLTFRLDDFGRTGPDGRPRRLHVDEALQVARLDPGGPVAPPPRVTGDGRVELARLEPFRMERWQLGGGHPIEQPVAVDAEALEVWTVLDGMAELHGAHGRLDLGRYATVVLPAGFGRGVWRGEATLVRGTA